VIVSLLSPQSNTKSVVQKTGCNQVTDANFDSVEQGTPQWRERRSYPASIRQNSSGGSSLPSPC